MPDIALHIGYTRLFGWKEISISRSMDTLCSSFNATLVDVWGENPMDLIPELECSIGIGDTKLLTGYIDEVSIKASPDGHSIAVKGRDKTCDLIDCSADISPGSWRNIEVQKLVYELCKLYNINVIKDTDLGEKVKECSLKTGESPFEVIQGICKDRGILLLTNSDGDLVLTSSGNRTSHDSLVYGTNILECEGSFEFVNRYSLYKVKGQKSGGGDNWKNNTTQIYGEAIDEGITRYRPLIITADGQITNSLANKRAAWEAQTRAGRSGKVTITIPTWYQSNGDLWDYNMLVSCDIPPLRVFPDEPLLIHEVEYKLSDGGSSCVLKLIRKDAYQSEPPKVIKTSKKSKSRGFGW